MSAQPTPFVENRAAHERSVQWARDRANAGDDTLEICPVCMCEVDVDPQPHRPGCPEIGKPRSSSAPVLAVLATVTRSPARRPPVRAGAAFNDGLDALERMDAGLPQQPELDEEDDVAVSLESGGQLGRAEPVSRSSSTRQRTWDRASIIAAIQRWNDEHGKPPTSTEWVRKHDGRPTMSTVINHFGSWSAAIEAAGFAPRRSGGQPGVSLGAAAPVRSWNRDEVVDAIARFASRSGGQPPTRRDWMHATEEHPNYAMAVKVCGSWAEAIEAAGFAKPTRGTRRQGTTSEERAVQRLGPEAARSSDAETVHDPAADDLGELRAAVLAAVNAMFDVLANVEATVAAR